MSTQGVLSTEYNRISTTLLAFNDAVLFLKDVFLGHQQHSHEKISIWLESVENVLDAILKPDMRRSEGGIPRATLEEIGRMLKSDEILQRKVHRLRGLVASGQVQHDFTKDDFDTLDQVASALSESASQAFRKLWRVG